jgi:hypothetical protein
MSALPFLDHRDAIAPLRSLMDRFEAETAMCRSIAASLKKPTFPGFGSIVTQIAHQSRSLGTGDVFDLVPTNSGQWIAYLADCGGPATPSGCLMGQVIRNVVTANVGAPKRSAGSLLSDINRQLLMLRATLPHLAVAMAVIIFDEVTHPCHFEIARAGLPTVIMTQETGEHRSLSWPGTLAGLSDINYPTELVDWQPHDELILSTLPVEYVRKIRPFDRDMIFKSIPDHLRCDDDRTVIQFSHHLK